jgi:PAS domain S-box-containing protein
MSSKDQNPTATVRITVPGRSRPAPDSGEVRAPAGGSGTPVVFEPQEPPAETQLAASETFLDAIYDAVLVCTAEGRICDVNDRAAALFQRTPDELCQLTAADVLNGMDEPLLADLLELTGPQPFAIVEAYGIRADGAEFAAEIAVHPMHQDTGVQLIFFVRDISRRIQMEQELLRLSKAAASTSDGIAITDEEGRQIYQNGAFLDLIGPQHTEALPERLGFGWLLGDNAQAMQQTIEAGLPWIGRADIQGSAGVVPTLIRVDPIRQEDGRIIGEVAIVTDVTKEIQAEERLRQTLDELERTNAELEQFAYVASHDLKEPLRVIAGYLDLLQRRYAEQLDDAAKGFIRHAMEGTERMRDMINHILDYARLNRPSGPLSTVSAALLVRQAQENLRSLLEERHARVTLDPLPDIRTAPARMVQVFQNLIDNAVRYCDQDEPRVHIRAVRREQFWVFLIQDNGIGIPKELQSRVFLLFQRLHTREEREGSGIGLATCRKIIERFGGSLWIEDSAPGRGSTFAFSVPLSGCTPEVGPPAEATPAE